MSVEIVPVKGRRLLGKFVEFNYTLYRNSPYAVPELRSDLMRTFMPEKNAAYEYCEAQCFLALRDGKVVGRVAAIINHQANRIWKTRTVRFGWIDFMDDPEVSAALIETVSRWGRERGMDMVEGPLGFTDFDREGMLTFGFDCPGTMATHYNYPYYPEHLKRLGFTEGAKWVEWFIPYSDLPQKMQRVSRVAKEKFDLHTVDITNVSKRDLCARYGQKLFSLINEAYAPLYGFAPFTENQIGDFTKRYLPLTDKRFLILIEDAENNLVGAGLLLPSLSEPLRKCGGRLFPSGWWHLLRALKFKGVNRVDLMFIAVKPERHNQGVSAIMFDKLMPLIKELGIKCGESNPELETNTPMTSHWAYFPGAEIKKQRHTFLRKI